MTSSPATTPRQPGTSPASPLHSTGSPQKSRTHEPFVAPDTPDTPGGWAREDAGGRGDTRVILWWLPGSSQGLLANVPAGLGSLGSMTNMYESPAGPPGQPQPTPRRPRKRVSLGARVAIGAVIAGGAAFAAVSLAGGAPAANTNATPAAASAGSASGPTGAAAVLNSLLASNTTGTGTPGASTASGTPSATSTPSTTTTHHRRFRFRLGRLRALGGMYGQFTFETKTGPRTLAFERGTIESVSSTLLVVRAQDGTTWSWQIGSTTRVSDHGTRASASSLANGQTVFVGGQVTDGAKDAELIVIRPVTRSASS
jgi:hypothetical protein